MKKLILLLLVAVSLASISYADGINPASMLYMAASTTQSITTSSTTVNHTIPGYVSIAPIDGDIRILMSGVTTNVADASCFLVKQGGIWQGDYYRIADQIKAISASGVSVLCRIYIEKYRSGAQ